MGIYIDALSIYNSNSKDGTKWITPRKDTAEYNEVMRIMRTLQSEKPKPKEPKPKKTKAAPKTKKEPIKTDTTVRG